MCINVYLGCFFFNSFNGKNKIGNIKYNNILIVLDKY